MKLTRRQALTLLGATAASGLSMPALAEKKKIKVGALRFTSHSASFIAFERGYFAEAGLDVEFQFFQAAQPMAVVDAWSIVPHIAKPLAKAGAWHIVGNVSDYLPDYQVTTVFTSAKNAANERAQTEAFLAAFSRGAADYAAAMIDQADGEDGVNTMVDLIHKYVYTDRPREKAAPSIINGTMRISTGAALNVGSVQDQLSWFQSEGLVDADISIDQLVDASYVDTVGG